MITIDNGKKILIKYYRNSVEYIKAHDNRRNRIIAIIVLAVIIGGISFLIASGGNKRTSVVNKFERTLKSSNPWKVYKDIVFENKDIKLTKENIKPFVDYINNDETRRDEIIRDLRFGNQGSNGIISLKEKDGKYYIELKEVSMILSTNLKNTEIFLNGDSYYRVQENDFSQSFESLIPGIYNIKAKVQGPYGEIEQSKDINIIGKNTSVNIPVKAVNLTLESNYTDSKVYINSEDSGKTIDQFKNIGPFPGDDSIKIYVEREFPWGKIKSEEKTVGELSTVRLDINPMTEDLKGTLENQYKEFYNSFFMALNKGDKSLIVNAKKEVKDYLYDKYKKKSLIISNSYNLQDLKWQKDAISIEYKDGVFSTYAIADVSYKQKKSLVIIPIDEEDKVVSFKTIMNYDNNEKKWIVTEVIEISG